MNTSRSVPPWASLRVVVAIATYQRPESLAALLKSLREQDANHIQQIIIVDNDHMASARLTATMVAPEAQYIVEPRRGISMARNAGIVKALEHAPDAIAFIDDDETADAAWIGKLVESMMNNDADVVTGPVEYKLTNTPADYKYFQKVQHPDGSPVKYVATNNVLVRTKWFEGAAPLRFNEAFGLTGGEDLELFLRLQQKGGLCIWSNGALVSTLVPAERTARGWLFRRELRNGQMIARLCHQFDGYTRPRMVLVGAAKLVQGLIFAASARARGRVSMAAEYKIFAGVGWLSAALGWYYREYRHPTPAAVSQFDGRSRVYDD